MSSNSSSSDDAQSSPALCIIRNKKGEFIYRPRCEGCRAAGIPKCSFRAGIIRCTQCLDRDRPCYRNGQTVTTLFAENASFRALIEKYKKEAAEDEKKKIGSKRQSPGRISKTKAPISSAISQPKPRKDVKRERAASEVKSTRNTRATTGEATDAPPGSDSYFKLYAFMDIALEEIDTLPALSDVKRSYMHMKLLAVKREIREYGGLAGYELRSRS